MKQFSGLRLNRGLNRGVKEGRVINFLLFSSLVGCMEVKKCINKSIKESRVLMSALLFGWVLLLPSNDVVSAPWGKVDSRVPEFLPGLGGAFTLQSASGIQSLADISGEWHLLGFGFSHCPSICSMLLAKMSQIHRQLGDNGGEVGLLFVSIDPARDGTKEGLQALQSFVSRFNDRFVGLSGSEEEVSEVAKQYAVYYGADEDTITHTDRIYLINKEGRIKTIFSKEATVEKMSSDILQLFDQ